MLVPILFWLSIPASLVSSVFGVVKNKYWLVFIGAILLFPISYYINGSPSIHGFGLLLPFFKSALPPQSVKKINYGRGCY